MSGCVQVLDHIRVGGQLWSPEPPDGVILNTTPAGQLAIVGTAPGWEYEAENIPADSDIMVVNDAGCDLTWRPVHWWATLHPEQIANRIARCLENGGDDKPILSPFPISSRIVPPQYFCRLPIEPVAGSSSMFAVLAGLYLGYRDIALYGVRLDDRYEEFRDQWVALAPALKKYVTAPCPGFPQDVFGAANKVAPE